MTGVICREYLLEDEEANVVPLPDLMQLDDVWMVLQSRRHWLVQVGRATYKDFENVDLVNEGRVILDLLLLNGLNRKLLLALTVLGQVHDAEAAIGKLLLERIDFFDVAFRRIHKVLRLVQVSRTVHAIRTTGHTRRALLSLLHDSNQNLSLL